eukprot:COSAG05_NODE_37_length_27688_cov_18.080394_11_plen_88_part_00
MVLVDIRLRGCANGTQQAAFAAGAGGPRVARVNTLEENTCSDEYISGLSAEILAKCTLHPSQFKMLQKYGPENDSTKTVPQNPGRAI